MTEVYEAHPHLYHYTNFGGLKGILESQTLWATHFKGLNDSSEIELMRPLLEKMLYKPLKALNQQLAQEAPQYREILKKYGGNKKAAQNDARQLIDSGYKVNFLGAPGIVPATEPYILSFCAHTSHNKYVKENGLLSLWRAYGGDGGYALVFDTERLWECLKAETGSYGYTGFALSDVVYDDQNSKIETEFADFRKDFYGLLLDYVSRDKNSKFVPSRAPSLFNVATRFKHRGFKEESEVRFSVSPLTEAYNNKKQNQRLLDSDGSLLKLKPILKKDGSHAPYIVLNDVPEKQPLPIFRIIIGPQRDQKQRAKDVKKLIGKKKIEIVCSKTPYLPPQAHISS